MSRIKDLISQLAMIDQDRIQGPLTTFHPLPRLPLELRQKIWKDSCFAPRVVPLLHRALGAGPSKTCSEILKTQRGVPDVLHASKESRKEARRYYTAILNRVYRQKSRDLFIEEVPAGAKMIRESFPGHKEGGSSFGIYPYTYAYTPCLIEKHGEPSTFRMYFVNFEADIFWHPQVEPLGGGPSYVVSVRFMRHGGTSSSALMTVPAGQPIYEMYNFTDDVLSRIQRLLLPFYYEERVFTALQKQYFLYAARPANLKEVIFEMPANEGEFESESVDGHLAMAERENRLYNLVMDIEGPKIIQDLKDIQHGELMAGLELYQSEEDEAADAFCRLVLEKYQKQLSRTLGKPRLGFSWVQSNSGDLVPACADACAVRF